MGVESSILYQEFARRVDEVPAPSGRLSAEFDRIQDILREHGKYIVRVFPEYTPHDPSLHLDHLFPLADRILGLNLYQRLNATELVVLVFSLFSHDWGMAVSDREQSKLEGSYSGGDDFFLPSGEPDACRAYLAQADAAGLSKEQAWANYLRRTHGLRSGARLRAHLQPVSAMFAEAVAKAAEGHTLDVADIRDTYNYPVAYPLFGQTINLAAIANYVRIVDLLDIGENRTPFALWKFIQPQNPISSLEWRKHRSLSAVSVRSVGNANQVIVGGTTDDVRVYAALADLRSWIDREFQDSMTSLLNLGPPYALALDSRISWGIQARGFEPVLARFEVERSSVLGLLSTELYEAQPYAFVRELLQNSVDAIDARQALLCRSGISFQGNIQVSVDVADEETRIRWMDNGIGMDAHVIMDYFAVVGRSWYRSEEYERNSIATEPLSKFGIGFLSCFSVADRILVRTRKDPIVTSSLIGHSIEIPTRSAHFRITKEAKLPIGTEVELIVRRSKSSTFSVEAFCRHLEKFCLYIAHNIAVTINGVSRILISLDHLERVQRDSIPFEISPTLQIRSVVAKTDDPLRETTRIYDLSFGGGDKEYAGRYSALVPLDIESAEKTGNWRWRLSGADVDLESYIHNASDDVFVKGVLAGPLRGNSRHTLVTHAPTSGVEGYGDWIGPKVSLNVKRSSLVHFNLARTNATLTTGKWHDEMWEEITKSVRNILFITEPQIPLHCAQAIGVASRFAGIPSSSLKHIVPTTNWPTLAIVAGEGMKLTRVSEHVGGEAIYEVPIELAYGLANSYYGTHFLQGIRGLTGWTGPPAIVVTFHGNDQFPYWVNPIVSSMKVILSEVGFAPSAIYAVPTIDSKDPLFCRVWKKRAPCRQTAEDFLKRGDGAISDPFLLKEAIGEFAPELYEFPHELSDLGAIGSAYWNSRSPHVIAITMTLLELCARIKNGKASQQNVEKFGNLTSNRYNGFVVPCCKSGRRLAIGMHAGLLEIATAEGLGFCSPLSEKEALPGSVGRYENPYHYDLRRWMAEGQVSG